MRLEGDLYVITVSYGHSSSIDNAVVGKIQAALAENRTPSLFGKMFRSKVSLLVLLCYKNWRRQQGHLGRERARWVAIWRRRVAMECGLWRSVLIGSATGFRTVWQAG